MKDPEIRYRKRYLDLILNQKIREIFVTRAKVTNFIRKYLTALNFLEVETPILNTVPSGALAKPFATNYGDNGNKLFLRIAPELYLKQCVVGGFDRVF